MLRTRLNTRLKGYSLLELMIAIAIVAVLITLMVPPLFEQIYTARVDATARELAASARLARAEPGPEISLSTLARSTAGGNRAGVFG